MKNSLEKSSPGNRKSAFIFVVSIGIVSLFADMTYEGARSITGPYLGMLGANAAIVSAVAGFAELVGYVLRLAAGYLADRSRRYWLMTIFGYACNLLAVPMKIVTSVDNLNLI